MEQTIEIDGQTVTIRPVNANDTELEKDFIEHLSPQSKHFRFLGGVHHLSAAQLKQLCEVDYDHSMAFIASINHDGKEEQIGVSRYATQNDSDNVEFAVTVTDDWQHKGLGTILMKKLIAFAKEKNLKQLYSVDLATNSHMRHLANELNMQAKADPDDATLVIHSLDLTSYKE